PQLRHLKWLTEVTGTKIGTWPVYEIPMKMTKTPAYIGGPINRGAPCYGEDNMYVLTELLGRTPSEVERLAEEGVIYGPRRAMMTDDNPSCSRLDFHPQETDLDPTAGYDRCIAWRIEEPRSARIGCLRPHRFD